ncbi:MAG TPA: hypothetical protein VEL11_02915 [Candidatus Bathyarchaeia archaeon]|nr:hypothetical protein [Candidatus Bathyarchaeia archaeon]
MAATIHDVGIVGVPYAIEPHHKRDSSRVSVIIKDGLARGS